MMEIFKVVSYERTRSSKIRYVGKTEYISSESEDEVKKKMAENVCGYTIQKVQSIPKTKIVEKKKKTVKRTGEWDNKSHTMIFHDIAEYSIISVCGICGAEVRQKDRCVFCGAIFSKVS